MKDSYYVASMDETLKEIAVKTGVGYTRLLKYNPQYSGGVPKGAKVILFLDKIDTQESENKETEKKQENIKTEDTKTENKKTEDKNTVSQNKQQSVAKEEKPSTVDIEKYEADMRELENSFSASQKKLADSLGKTRNKSEHDFVRQKIDASSIAENERDEQTREFSAKREALKSEYDEKMLKLSKTLEAIKNKK